MTSSLSGRSSARCRCPSRGAMLSSSPTTSKVGIVSLGATAMTFVETDASYPSDRVVGSLKPEKYRPCSSWIQRRRVRSEVLESFTLMTVSYTHLRAHETVLDLVCRLLLEK